MDNFEHEKQQSMGKLDKSNKGSIDSGIRTLISSINRKKDYYTTSSCSGRTMLIIAPEKGRKCDSEWIYASHGRTIVKDMIKALEKRGIENKGIAADHSRKMPAEICPDDRQPESIADDAADSIAWFKKESMILHVCCRTIESASILADSAVKAGFRRTGILARRKIIVEINDTEKIEAPVSSRGKMIVDDDYLKVLVKLADEKHKKTKKKISLLNDMVRRI